MTGFITRNYGQKEFEVIIKTDNKDHYKQAEDFARKLIDHAKPQTNADRIRAMSDEELAEFLADDDRACPPKWQNCRKHISECGGCWLEWLKQPAEEATPFQYEKGFQPHGAEQFAKACGVCVNVGSDLCRECKMEKKSGFEPPF